MDPESHLRDILTGLRGCSTDPAALRELFPANWAAAHKAALTAAALPGAA